MARALRTMESTALDTRAPWCERLPERESTALAWVEGAPMALHVIVGKGPVGSTTAEELVARGHEVRVLSRSGGRSTAAIEHRQVDATDAGALTEAARG